MAEKSTKPEWDRSELLRSGQYLEETDFKDVTMGPDQTRKQRGRGGTAG